MLPSFLLVSSELSAGGQRPLPCWKPLLHHGGPHGVLWHVRPQGEGLQSQTNEPGHARHVADHTEEGIWKWQKSYEGADTPVNSGWSNKRKKCLLLVKTPITPAALWKLMPVYSWSYGTGHWRGKVYWHSLLMMIWFTHKTLTSLMKWNIICMFLWKLKAVIYWYHIKYM